MSIRKFNWKSLLYTWILRIAIVFPYNFINYYLLKISINVKRKPIQDVSMNIVIECVTAEQSEKKKQTLKRKQKSIFWFYVLHSIFISFDAIHSFQNTK